MTEVQIDAYFLLLKDVSETALQAAVVRALMESENPFTPSVGLIRKYASEHLNGVIPDWGPEWERVMKACRTFGRARPAEVYDFLGQFTSGVVRQLGWQEICNSENIAATAKLFQSMYDSAAKLESLQRRVSAEVRPTIGVKNVVTMRDPKRITERKTLPR